LQQKQLQYSFFWIALILMSSACTTAKNRNQENNLYHVLKFKSAKTEQFFQGTYRAGNIYLDYGTVLIVDAIFKGVKYRRFLLQEMSDVYYYNKQTKVEKAKKHIENYNNYFEFLVFIYGGSNDKVDFGKPRSEWQIYLKDDEGDLLRANYIRKVKRKVKEVIFLDKYFFPLDRWSEIYRVRFPKYNKPRPQLENKKMTLIISGIRGKTKLEWKDLSVFYEKKSVFSKADLQVFLQ
jgi:hypothetical protein